MTQNTISELPVEDVPPPPQDALGRHTAWPPSRMAVSPISPRDASLLVAR